MVILCDFQLLGILAMVVILGKIFYSQHNTRGCYGLGSFSYVSREFPSCTAIVLRAYSVLPIRVVHPLAIGDMYGI